MDYVGHILIVITLVLFIACPLIVYCGTMPVSNEYLFNASEEEIAKIDIAEINLACAKGLPGAETLNIPFCLKIFDQWVAFVKQETDKQLYMFFRDPGDYNNSQAYFKILVMVTALQRDIAVKYNMELVETGVMDDISSTRFFRNPEDIFLHGILSNRLSGSCSSMPVLMVAVGRRLGYPLKLVSSKGHLFTRWESRSETFNIETAGQGLLCKPDSYYRKWPHPISDVEIKTEGYLKSMSPMEELSVFVELRAMCFKENKKYDEALRAFEKVFEIKPYSTILSLYINDINRRRMNK